MCLPLSAQLQIGTLETYSSNMSVLLRESELGVFYYFYISV